MGDLYAHFGALNTGEWVGGVIAKGGQEAQGGRVVPRTRPNPRSTPKSFACGAKLFIGLQEPCRRRCFTNAAVGRRPPKAPPTTETSKRRAAHDDSLVIAELGHDAGQPGVIVQCLRLARGGRPLAPAQVAASAWRTKRRGRNTNANERYQCTAFWCNQRLWQGS